MAQVDPLTMIDACGASWNHARKTLRSSLVFDASILLQTDCTLYQAVTETELRHQTCRVLVFHLKVSLTGQYRSRLARWCGHRRHSTIPARQKGMRAIRARKATHFFL